MKPILLHYYITNRCNARCEFCLIWKEPRKYDAQPEQVIQNLTAARKAGCRFVDFTGGEPLLNDHLPVFLKEAKKLGFITSVTTNCLIFKREVSRLDGLVDLLHFSIDSDIPSRNDRMRGGNSYAAVMESIKPALAHHLRPDLLFTYTNENIKEFEGIYRTAREHRLMVILDPVFNVEGTPDHVSEETHVQARKLSSRPGVYLNHAHLTLRKQGGNNPEKTSCRAVTSTIVILPDNSLALPCYHQYNETIDLTKTSLLQALSDPRRKEAAAIQGTSFFCKGCHINCYFDPSYGYQFNRLFFQSMWSKMRYVVRKYVLDRLGSKGRQNRDS